MWAAVEEWEPEHISLADRADLLLVAPADGALSRPLCAWAAPDLLSSIHLATRAPVMLAPAMNGKMLAHPATQANLQVLTERGYHFVEPASGMLACGYEGKGKLASVETIVDSVKNLLR